MSTVQGFTRVHANTHTYTHTQHTYIHTHTRARKQVHTQTHKDKIQWLYSKPWLTSVKFYQLKVTNTHAHKHSHIDVSGQVKRTFENKSNVWKASKRSKTNWTSQNRKEQNGHLKAYVHTHAHTHTHACSRTQARTHKTKSQNTLHV